MLRKVVHTLVAKSLALVLVLHLVCIMASRTDFVSTKQIHNAATTSDGSASRDIPSNVQMDPDAAPPPTSQFSSTALTPLFVIGSARNDFSLQLVPAAPKVAASSIVKQQHVFRI